MPGPWEKYAQQPQAEQGPWSQYAAAPEDTAPTPPPDDRNGLQKAFDGATEHIPYVAPNSAGNIVKDIGAAAGNFAGGLLEPLTPLVHLKQTLEGVQQEMQQPHKMSMGDMALSTLGPAGELGADLVKRISKGEGAEGLGNLATTLLVPEEGEAALAKLPSRAHAAELFQHVMEHAADEPVTLSKATMEPLERTQQLAMAGGKPFGTADKLYQRIQTINPLTYREARDFASNMSLSPEEKMGLKRSMQYEVPRLSKAFNEDVGAAAARRGVGSEYEQAMKEYRQAARNAEIAKKVAKWGGGAAAGAIGLEGAHRLAKVFQ